MTKAAEIHDDTNHDSRQDMTVLIIDSRRIALVAHQLTMANMVTMHRKLSPRLAVSEYIH